MPRSLSYPRCRVLLGILLYEDSEVHWVEGVEPRDAEWECNTYLEADTARVVIDYAQVPLDPRMIRSVWVGVWAGDVESPTADIDLDDERFQAFAGYADEPRTDQDDGGDWLTLTCRDYTALFLDTRWPGGYLRVDRPLRDVVQGVLDLVPGASGMEVAYAGDTAGLQLSEQLGRSVYTPDDGDDCWTVLVDLLGRVGLIPVVRLTTLRIETASTFGARRAAFTYGSNVARLTTRRALHGQANAAVEVVAYNEATGQRQSVTYPDAADGEVIAVDGSVATAPTTVIPYFVSGSYSQGDLQAIAERVYDQRAREAVEGDLVTRDLWDLEDGTRLPLLANGDRIEIRLAEGLSADIRDMSEAEAVQVLTSGPRPMDRGVARALAAAQVQARNLAVEFYVRRARHRFSVDEGYQLAVEFINYVGGEP